MVQNSLLHKKRRRRIKVDPRLFPLPLAPFQLFQSSVIIKLDFFNVSNQRPCQEDSHHLDAKSQDTTLHSDQLQNEDLKTHTVEMKTGTFFPGPTTSF